MCSTYLMVGIDFVSDLISAKASRLASMWGRKAGSMTETDVGVQINERQVQQRKERSAMWGRLEERRGGGMAKFRPGVGRTITMMMMR